MLERLGGVHQQDWIIDPKGICKALSAGSHLNAAWMTLIYEGENIHDSGKQPEEPIQG